MNIRPSKHKAKFLDSEFAIEYPAKDNSIDVSGLVTTEYNNITEFDYFVAHFGGFFNFTRNSKLTPEESEVYNDISILPESEETSEAFAEIKYFANLGGDEPEITEVEHAERIIHAYDSIYKSLNDKYGWANNSDAYLVPLKGGGIAARLFPLPEDQVLHLDAKRLPVKNNLGEFSFGMRVGKNQVHYTLNQADDFMNSLSGKSVTILEVCVASGMTTVAFMLDLYFRSVKPEVVRILSTATSLQGADIVYQFAKEMDIKVEFITGKVATKLADHYMISQDSIIDEDGKLEVLSPVSAYEIISGEKIV